MNNSNFETEGFEGELDGTTDRESTTHKVADRGRIDDKRFRKKTYDGTFCPPSPERDGRVEGHCERVEEEIITIGPGPLMTLQELKNV